MPDLGVQLINPLAGNHPVSSDPREVAASAAAGERSWREFPYYEARFGERGRRFGHSDSAWLSLAARHGAEHLRREVLWLGDVLSARGMPQWMLERHLEFLHDELVRAVPERRAVYDKLLSAAKMLRDRRLWKLGEHDFSALAAAFNARVGPEWSARFPHMGGLLAAAVADERNGVARAVASLEEWAADPSRFPPHWIDAVADTIAGARERSAR
ncbi:MAG TPA: hypothetical protein VM890_03100 [Longimicrobium sp.]|jgi:hypothetical protein|nr:hypothetical protein [Longimicrobium sp.]